MSKIVGDMAGCYSPIGKTFVFQDLEGNEIVSGVCVDQEKMFDAGVMDVREGKTFVNDEGAMTGEKNIPGYRTFKSSWSVFPGDSYSIPLSKYNLYDYTEFSCIIAKFNTSFTDSVAANKISLENNVYEVNSTTPLSQVSSNQNTMSIDLNITNNTEDVYIIHYFTYKEEY